MLRLVPKPLPAESHGARHVDRPGIVDTRCYWIAREIVPIRIAVVEVRQRLAVVGDPVEHHVKLYSPSGDLHSSTPEPRDGRIWRIGPRGWMAFGRPHATRRDAVAEVLHRRFVVGLHRCVTWAEQGWIPGRDRTRDLLFIGICGANWNSTVNGCWYCECLELVKGRSHRWRR